MLKKFIGWFLFIAILIVLVSCGSVKHHYITYDSNIASGKVDALQSLGEILNIPVLLGDEQVRDYSQFITHNGIRLLFKDFASKKKIYYDYVWKDIQKVEYQTLDSVLEVEELVLHMKKPYKYFSKYKYKKSKILELQISMFPKLKKAFNKGTYEREKVINLIRYIAKKSQ